MNVYGAFHANHEIIPGILEKDWAYIEKKIGIAKPYAKTLHIDLIDGIFADNTTYMDPESFSLYAKDFTLELHMMVDNPTQYIKPFAQAGFKRFIGHIERMNDIAEFVAEGQLFGEVGLGIDSVTPLETLKINLDDIDTILIMTVKAGLSGQLFMPEMLEKVKSLRARAAQLPIEVDGGITDKTIEIAKQAGATRFVATSFLFESDKFKGKYESLLNILR